MSRLPLMLIGLLMGLLGALPMASADPLGAGNEAFWKGEHAGAAKAYRAAIKQQPKNADLWYNLGTAEAHAGRFGHAVHAFEQALILRPDDEDTEHNLTQTRSQILETGLAGAGDARVVPPGEDDVGTGLLTALSAQFTAVVFLVSWAAVFALIAVWRRTEKPALRTAASFVALIMGLIAITSGGALLARALVLDQAKEGVVLTRSVTYSGPGKTYKKGPMLLGGVKLRLRGADSGWRQVTLPDGSEGWIIESSLGVLTR